MYSPAFSGIACIALSFVDSQGNPLQVPAQDGTRLQRSEIRNIPLHQNHFNELTTVSKVSSNNLHSSTGKHNTERNLSCIIIWLMVVMRGLGEDKIKG